MQIRMILTGLQCYSHNIYNGKCWFHGRAVRLIEIEIKSRFEIARFLNRFIARFFSAPRPNLPQYAIRTNQNAAEQNRPGIQTDSKETGKMSSEQDKDLVAKKMHVACRAHSGK